ncbi:MAG: LysM peptidoglycan-binding domain-containing protein [Gemmatimonadota bacterium]|nr:LysM peptidoglycan-binding domain-containing protein [Gemmatimonadota bacterium]
MLRPGGVRPRRCRQGRALDLRHGHGRGSGLHRRRGHRGGRRRGSGPGPQRASGARPHSGGGFNADARPEWTGERFRRAPGRHSRRPAGDLHITHRRCRRDAVAHRAQLQGGRGGPASRQSGRRAPAHADRDAAGGSEGRAGGETRPHSRQGRRTGGRPAAGGERVHTVRPGDTLWRIARLHEVELERLLAHNELSADDKIFPGDRIRIPSGGR